MQQRLGKYELLERIGQGGQGTVYRARDTDLDRIVAIKIIDQSVADDPAYSDALRREARLAASLDHPKMFKELRPLIRQYLNHERGSHSQFLQKLKDSTVRKSDGTISRDLGFCDIDEGEFADAT